MERNQDRYGREKKGYAAGAEEKGQIRESRLLNNGWKFVYGFREADEISDWEQWPDVGLPHSFGIPYFMENEFYVGYGCYRRELELSKRDLEKRLLLEFHGAFQCAEVFLNGVPVGEQIGRAHV